MRSKYSHKNNPRLGGLLLDVIPQQFEKYQPLDTFILAKLAFFVNIFSLSVANSNRPTINHCLVVDGELGAACE